MSENLPAVIQSAIQAQKIDTKNVNLMIPSETYGLVMSKFEKVIFEIVKINQSSEAKEVYDQGKEKALTKVGLNKLALAAGIEWDPANCDITLSTDYKSIAKATGRIKHPNGKYIPCTETKTIDCSLYEEEQREAITKEAENGDFYSKPEWKTATSGKKYPVFQPWKSDSEKAAGIEKKLREIVRQRRKFKDELAMTGAKERVIRYFFSMKGTYTTTELNKPFVIPHILLDTDAMLEDPMTRRAAIQNMNGSVSDIFGGREKDEENAFLIAPPRNVTKEESDSLEDIPPNFEEEKIENGLQEVKNLRKLIKECLEKNHEIIEEKIMIHYTTFLEQNMASHYLDNLNKMLTWLIDYIARQKGTINDSN